MKTKILIICLVFFSFVQSQMQLSVQLEVDKTTYYISEFIFLKMSFHNKTDKPVPIYYISLEHLKIKDDKDRVYRSNISFFGPRHAVAPGDSFVFFTELLSGHSDLNLQNEDDFFGFPSGAYTVQLKFENKNVHTTSNILSFNIVEPEGAEKEALKLYSKMRYMNSHKKEFDPEETIQVGLTLVEKYPNSVYSPSVLMLANVIEENRTGSSKYFEQLINDYPNNRTAWSSVKYHFNVFDNYDDKQKSELIRMVKTAKEKYPNSLVAQEAAKQLKKLGIK